MPPNSVKNSLVTGGIFNAVQGDFHVTYSEGRKGMDLLINSIASGAFHNSAERYDPPKCHPSTRVAVLQHIMTWINDLQKLCFFMWLYGPAGTGKSAIAQSIAELCHKSNLLAASFFFSRTAVGRNDESRLILTLVYQLCLSMPAIRKYVEDTIEQDPLVLSRSLEAQISSLMVDPLRRALLNDKDAMSLHSGPKLIIIDGLDECGTAKVQRYVLSVLAVAVQEIPLPISFLVASRPEQIIRDAFRAEPLGSMTRQLVLDDSYGPDDDIKLFIQSKFEDIKQNHPLHALLPPEWPSGSELDRLVQKSSGQFIYSSTVMKYLDSPHHWPTDRLEIIFGLSNPGVDTPFAELDALYIQIFSTVKNINRALEILSLLLLTRTKMEITPQLLEDLFFLRHGDIYIILSDLHSVIDVPAPSTDEVSSVIRTFHASLGDFLLDKSRSGKFYIDAGNAHANLTRYFLKHLSKTDLSTSKAATREHFAYAFTTHCPLSSPTPELLNDLDDFDFYMFLTTFGSLDMIKGCVSYVFGWLKGQSQNYHSQKNLYSHHLLSLDKYLRSGLALLTSHSSLAQMMVTGVMLPKFYDYYYSAMDFLGVDLDQESFNAFRRACQPIICPYEWDHIVTGIDEMATYYDLLSEFLDDPIRSKEFYIDGDKFAALATAFSKNLFSPLIDNPSYGPLKYGEQFLVYVFSCLPSILPKASPSKGISAFLQNHEIPSYIQDHDHNLDEIAEAIKNYILRCNILEVQGENVIMDQSDQKDGPNCMAQIVPRDDLKLNHSSLTAEVGNSLIVCLQAYLLGLIFGLIINLPGVICMKTGTI
ncbi:hypothetical protein BYT27DRAFT_6949245 [Phlegmacium glaucopus]|nr:hypothetical protein BYT27DRAFT_6949245 [Phlegmacium glaucopus]